MNLANGLTKQEQIAHYIDLWKKSVEVQQHFNDIEWRIRGLALTAATFALGAAAVATKDGAQLGWFSLGSVVIVIGLLLWYAFYFVDRHWYHPLLKAAVHQGTLIEKEIQATLPKAGMTAGITTGSKLTTGRIVRRLSRKKTMQSDDKLVWFYQVGAFALIAAALALQCGALFRSSPPSAKELPATVTPSISPPYSTNQYEPRGEPLSPPTSHTR